MPRMDFNDAPTGGGGDRELIPTGAIVKLKAKLRPGGGGDDALLKYNKDQTCLMADMEFTVVGGQYDRRKIWETWVLETFLEENHPKRDGHDQAVIISKSRIRAVLESALGIEPKDQSPGAVQARGFEDYQELNGLVLLAKIGVEASRGYKPKNVIASIITPDKADWSKHMGSKEEVRARTANREFQPSLAGSEDSFGLPDLPLGGARRNDMDDEIPF